MDKVNKTHLFLWIAAISICAAFIAAPSKQFKSDENPATIVGTHSVSGYYASYEKRKEYDGEFFGTTTCDAFVEVNSNNPLITSLKNSVISGNTVNSFTPHGNLRINIDLSALDRELQNKIKLSSPQNPIALDMKERIYADGKEIIGCGIFVDIVGEK